MEKVLPKDWKIVSLGSISETIMGQAPASKECNTEGNGTPFVKVGQFGQVHPKINEWTTTPLKKVDEGDVLICVVGATIGKINLATDCAIGRSVAGIRPNKEKLHTVYLFAFLRKWTERLRSSSQGSAIGVLTKQMLHNLEIPLPPLSTQHKIVKILEEADNMRKLRKQADEKMNDLTPSLFVEMFGDPGTNPKGWDVKSLSEHGAVVRYGLGQPPNLSDNGVPLIRAINISHGYINKVNMIYVDPLDVPKSRNAFLSANEVIVVRSGAYTGDVAQVTKEWEGSVAGYDLVISPGNNICGEFLASYLPTPYVQRGCFYNLKTRTGQPHLNKAQLGNTPTFLPPLPLQQEFAERVKEVEAEKERQAESKKKLDELFDGLMQRAFRGELVA